MADEELRELERRWRASGAIDDEARYLIARLRMGLQDSDGLTSEMIYALINRLLEAELKGPDVARVLAKPRTSNWALRLQQMVVTLGFEPDPPEVDHEPFGSPTLVLEYADEETETTCRYPEGFAPRPWQEQLAIWQQRYPGLDADRVEALVNRSLPSGAEGWLVMPKPTALALATEGGIYPYMRACRLLMTTFHAELGIVDDPFDESVYAIRIENPPDHIPWIMNFDGLTEGDYLVLPVQFGLRHAGRSANRARYLIDSVPMTEQREEPCGLYEVLAILITHPQRIAPVIWSNLTAIITAMDYYGLDPATTIRVDAGDDHVEFSLTPRSRHSIYTCVPSWFLPTADESREESNGEPYTNGP